MLVDPLDLEHQRSLSKGMTTLPRKMILHAILIINKAGGLIYNKDLANGISKLTSNEYLVLAGTLHGIHAITSQISPVSNSTGLEFLQSGNLCFYCFQSPTGKSSLNPKA